MYEEAIALKRLKTKTLRKSKSLRVISHCNNLVNDASPKALDHKRKRALAKSRRTGDSLSIEAVVERDKLSSSSSCDLLSTCDVRTAGSPEADSSSSAPSKLAENPSELIVRFQRKGLMEILQEESESLSSKARRVYGNSSRPLNVSQVARSSVNDLVASQAQSYPSSPASPSVVDGSKSAVYLHPNTQSTRKQISVTSLKQSDTDVNLMRQTKRFNTEPQMPVRLRPQFESFVQRATPSFQHQLPKATIIPGGVETIDLISDDGQDTDNEMPHGLIANDESAAAVFHLEQNASIQYGRPSPQQQVVVQASSRVLKNGLKPPVSDYLQAVRVLKPWVTPEFVAAPQAGNYWTSHPNPPGAGFDNVMMGSSSVVSRKRDRRMLNSQARPQAAGIVQMAVDKSVPNHRPYNPPIDRFIDPAVARTQRQMYQGDMPTFSNPGTMVHFSLLTF